MKNFVEINRTPSGVKKNDLILKSIVRNKARWLLTLFAILIIGVGQVKAAKWFYSEGQWDVQYWDGSSDKWVGAQNNKSTVNLGVKTTLWIKKGWVKTDSDGGWTQSDCCWYYGMNTDYSSNYNVHKNAVTGQQTWDYDITDYDAISAVDGNPGEYTFYMYWRLDDYVSADASYINFTIPGFTTTSTSRNFGSENIINMDNESIISFGQHYGTALTTSNCSITGTNASMFYVRDISETGVTVVFKPTGTGSKSATLTITDAHGKTCSISLSGSGVALGSITRLYFNDYINHSDWGADDAKYRFVCQYTSGVYTNFPMTKCDNSTYNYYADVELKAGNISTSIDRYNPTAPNKTWSSSSLSLSSSNPYAVSNGKYTAYATSFHPFNDVTTGGHFYYDNSQSAFTGTLYLIIGHEYFISGSTDLHSVANTLTNIPNTKLYYSNSYSAWSADANYYAVVGATSAPSISTQGSSCLPTIGTGGYTKAYQDIIDILGGNAYLASATGSNTDMTIKKRASTASSSLNSTQTFKYALATGGTAAASASLMNSGSTPATITIASYKFTNGTYNSVGASSSPAKNISAGTSGTYSKDETAGYTATTTITVSNINESYRFKGFYTAAGGGSQLDDNNGNANDYVYYPKSATTIFARFVSLYSVSYDINGGTGTLPTKGAGAHESGANVVLGNNNNSDGNGNISRAGYSLSGWNTEADGSGSHYNLGATISSIGESKTLYAEWTEVPLTFSTAGNWNVAGNWTRTDNGAAGCVPTIKHDVTIAKPVMVNVANAQAKSVKIDKYGSYTGKVTIEEDAGLVVAQDILAKHKSDGSYEATSKEDLQIRTDNTGNGGLITGNECEDDTAEYVFYTKAYKYTYSGHSYYINQYVGIPFVNMYAYQLYGFNIFVYDGTADDWRTPGSATLEAWEAYNLIRKYSSDDWSYFYLDGILNLPGKTGTKTFTCGWRATDRGSIDEEDGHQDYLFANSWTAPISIKDITSADCSGTGGADLVQNIYIFNAGYVGDGQKTLGDYAGTWSTFPLASSAYMDGAVIPATQAFMVTSKKGSSGATLTLDYKKHVYDPATAGSGMNTDPTRAPRRAQTDDAPNVLKIVVSNDSVNADQLYLFEREDFSYGFDNGWDGHKVPGLAFAPQLYAINGASQMAVNAVPDMNGVGIGFKAGVEASEYTFSFEYADDAEPIYLYDFDTQVYTLISNEATYTFTTSDKDEHARFAITRNNAPQIATDYEQMEAGNMQHAEKFLKNDMLFIRRGGKIYNAEGILVK